MKIPKGWKSFPLDKVVDPNRPISYGVVQTGANVTDGVPCVRVVDLTAGSLDPNKMIRTSIKTSGSYGRTVLRAGDLMIALRGEIGKAATVPPQLEGANLTRGIALLSQHSRQIVGKYLLQALSSPKTKMAIRHGVNGTGLKEIPIGNLRKVMVDLPSLPEQQKIADILGTWDEALVKLDTLIAAKAHRKQALMQQLLTGHRRLLGFTKPWSKVQLSDVAEECSERNRELLDRTRLYAVTKANGMVPMRENVQGKTINRCLLVEQDWFAYNPMRINIGSIARWEGESPVMVSPDYVAFRTKESRLLSDYLNHTRRGSAWTYFVGAAGNGSVRVRIWFDDLGCFKFLLPPVDEQRAIADILDTADTELRLLRQQREALDQQKRGLMQQLLTGKVRVTV